MEVQDRISALESRARALGLTLTDLCLETGVSRSTVSRWRNGHGSPTLRLYGEVFGKIEAAVTAHEIARRDHLVALHGAGEQKSEVRGQNSLAPEACRLSPGDGQQKSEVRGQDSLASDEACRLSPDNGEQGSEVRGQDSLTPEDCRLSPGEAA